MANSKEVTKTQYWHPTNKCLRTHSIFAILTKELGELTNENVSVFYGCALQDTPRTDVSEIGIEKYIEGPDGIPVHNDSIQVADKKHRFLYGTFEEFNLPEMAFWRVVNNKGKVIESDVLNYSIKIDGGNYIYTCDSNPDFTIIFKKP